MISYEQYEADFKSAEQAAKDSRSCFCVCGHNAPVATPDWLGRAPICPECSRGEGHGRPQRPVQTYDWDAYEAADGITPQPTSRLQRLVKAIVPDRERQEAEAYVRAHPEMDDGQPLSDSKVKSVLRSKAADTRADEAAAKRIAKDETRAGKAFDLNHVFIPESLSEGDYGVRSESGDIVLLRVSRPTDGLLWGFTVINHVLGDEVERWGVQYPQPYREHPTYRQTYRGAYAHLVYQLVSNPGAAKALYEEVSA